MGWYFWSAKTAATKTIELQTQIDQKQNELKDANNLSDRTDGKTVESLSSEVVQSISTYQKLIVGKKVWTKVFPEITKATLKGVSVTSISVDDKLAIKLDCTAVGYTDEGGNYYSSNGLMARQLIAFRDAVFTAPTPTSPTASPSSGSTESSVTSQKPTTTNIKPLFTSVDLSSSTLTNVGSNALAKFSFSLNLNPEIVAAPSPTPSGGANER